MSERTVRSFSREFKGAAVQRIEAGERLREVAQALGVHRKLLYDWRQAYRAEGLAGFKRRGPKPKPPPDQASDAQVNLAAAERRIAELERKIGRQAVELDFFRRALQARPAEMKASKPVSTASCKR